MPLSLDLPETVLVSLLVAWAGYGLINVFSETRKLRHIPTAGYDGILLSYWSAAQFVYDPPEYLRREWAKLPPGAKWVKLPYLSRWLVVPASPEYYKEVANAPEHILSQGDFTLEFLKAKHTMFYDEIKGGLALHLIRGNLTRNLKRYVPLLYEELDYAFPRSFPLKNSDNEWTSFEWSPEAAKIIAAMTNRVLVGLPLCRNPEYLENNVKYAVEAVLESYLLSAVPQFLQPLAHKLFSPIPRRFKNISNFLKPSIDKHLTEREKGDMEREEPEPVLKWLVDLATEHNKPTSDPVKRIMNLNFGSLHTTVQTFTHALYSLLSRPEYLAPIRAEVDRCIQEHGWTKDAVDQMHLVDGFIKESLRFDLSLGVVSGGRIAAQDTTLAGIPIPKGTMIYTNVVDAHFNAVAYGPTTHEFDPYRFIKVEKETGHRPAIVTTSVTATTFGHGRHACPGRFFAAQEEKMLLAYMLHKYDMKLDSVDGKRPRDTWFAMVCVPNRHARICLRKRESD